MRIPFLLLLALSIQANVAVAQWDLFATQPIAPDQLAIDSCGNGYARVANRVYRTPDMGQTWQAVLDVSAMLSPSYAFTSTAGLVNLTSNSTKQGVLRDYQFACDGSVDTSFFEGDLTCNTYPFEVIQKGNERVFVYYVPQPRGGSFQYSLAVDEGGGDGIQTPPVQLSEAFYYELQQDPSGTLAFSHQPSIDLISPPSLPSVKRLSNLFAGWSLQAKEQVPTVSFAEYSVVIAKRNQNFFVDSLAIATYSTLTEQWSAASIDPIGFIEVQRIGSDQFLFVYTDKLELREATVTADVIRTIPVPTGFRFGNYSEDLSYIIGTLNDRVIILHNDIPTVGSTLAGGIANWNPTTAGSVLVREATGFVEYTSDNGSPAVIDLDLNERLVSSDTIGRDVYAVRQLNNRRQFLVTFPDGSTEILIDTLNSDLTVLQGGNEARIVRIGSSNYRLEAGTLSPITGRFSNVEVLVRSADTLFVEDGKALIKRGDEVSILLDGQGRNVLLPQLLGDIYLIPTSYSSNAPFVTIYEATAVDIQSLQRLEQFSIPGRIQRLGSALVTAVADGSIPGFARPPYSSLQELSWDGQQLVATPISIPTMVTQNTGQLCNNGTWQSFEQTVSGYEKIRYLNGATYVSGIHGVFKTMDCLAPSISRGYVCLEMGEIFNWIGQVIDAPGIYVDTLLSSSSCNEIAYLHVGQPSIQQLDDCFLDGRSIPLGDTSYVNPGTYLFSQVDASGCAQLEELTITAPDTFRIDTTVQLGEILFGEEVTSNGQQISTTREAGGCTEVVIYAISLTSSTSSAASMNELRIYPTLLGSDGIFRVDAAGREITQVDVFTLSGKRVELLQVGTNAWKMKQSAGGVHVVNIQTSDKSFSRRIVVE